MLLVGIITFVFGFISGMIFMALFVCSAKEERRIDFVRYEKLLKLHCELNK